MHHLVRTLGATLLLSLPPPPPPPPPPTPPTRDARALVNGERLYAIA